jgi:phage I-like protein
MYELCQKDDGLCRLFNDLNGTEGIPEWIPYLPLPGTYKHPKYGDIEITRDRNTRFVTNFENKVYQETLPVDAEHQGKLSGALAHIKGMRVNGNGSVDARVEWTDRGKQLMEKRAFRYFSPEFFKSWTDPATQEVHEDVAAGGALTNRPFFKDRHLRPLIAASEEIFSLDDDESLDGDTFFFAPLPGAGGEKNMSKKTEPEKPVKLTEFLALSEEDQLAALIAAEETAGELITLKEENGKLKGQVDTLKATQEGKDEEIVKLTGRVSSLEANERTRRFTALVENGEDPAWVGERDKHVHLLSKIAESFGEDSDEFKAYVEQQKAVAKQLSDSGIFTELGSGDRGDGSDDTNAGDKIVKMAEKMVAESDGKMTLADAISEVYHEHPELAEKDREETQVKV